MSKFDESRAAAVELMERWVMPNLDLTKIIAPISSCSWRHTVFKSADVYKNSGDHEAYRRCLELLSGAGEHPEDRDMVLYLLAFEHVRFERYEQAIATLAQIPAESKWANSREKLTATWKEKQAARQQTGSEPSPAP